MDQPHISDRRCPVRPQDERDKCAVKSRPSTVGHQVFAQLAPAAGSCQHATLISAGREVSGGGCRNGTSARISTSGTSTWSAKNDRRYIEHILIVVATVHQPRIVT
jgi:hypothetical protein